MKNAVSLLVGAVLLVASSIVGFAGPVSAIGVAPWVDVSGPGGGTVYYYSANGFACGVDLTNTCHFLEVAGSDWDATSRKWSSNNHSVAGTSTALGNGAKNTSLIVAGNSTLGYAASDANAFVSDTGLGDWFLPSRVEVRLMDGGQYSSDFGEVGTSSQVNANWWHTYDSRRNSDINDTPKGENKIVLAVRAFSKSDSSLASVSVVGEVLTPGFDPSVTSYSVTTSESSVQLTAVAVGASSVLVGASSGSSSVGNGTQSAPISLEAGLNQVTLTVTAADSTSTSYTLNITREMPGYAVSYDGNGSTGGSVPGVQAKSHGVDLTVASNSGSLVREGYSFTGWNTRAEGDGTAYAEGATYATDAVVTLYAVWTGNPLTVTYDARGGSVVADGATVVGGVITELPQAPIRAGFTFTGWFASSSGGTAISSPYTHGRTADFSLYAQWAQSSLYGLGSVTKIGTITTIDGVGNTFSAETSSSSVSLRYPADGLPASTVIDIYLVNDMSRAESLVPAGGGYVVSLVVAWLAGDGTVPSTATGKPLSMTITNSTILAGAKTYAIVGGQITLLGTASVDGLVTISITDDPEIVVVNPATPPTTTTPTTTTTTPPTTTTTTTTPPTTTPPTTPGVGGGGGSGGQPSSTPPPSTQPPSSQRLDAPSFVDSGNAAELVRPPGQGAGLVNGEARPVQIGTVRSPGSQVAPSQPTPEQIAQIREAAKELVDTFTSMWPLSSKTIIDVVNSETGAMVRGLLTDDSGAAIDVPAESIVVVGMGSVAMMVGGENSSITDSGALSVPEDSVIGLAGGGLGVSQLVQVVIMSTLTVVAEFVSNDDGTFMLSGTFLSSIGPGDHTLVLSTADVQVSLGIRITESASRSELPVTGSGSETTDLLVTLALFLLVFGVLGLRLVARRSQTIMMFC